MYFFIFPYYFITHHAAYASPPIAYAALFIFLTNVFYLSYNYTKNKYSERVFTFTIFYYKFFTGEETGNEKMFVSDYHDTDMHICSGISMRRTGVPFKIRPARKKSDFPAGRSERILYLLGF